MARTFCSIDEAFCLLRLPLNPSPLNLFWCACLFALSICPFFPCPSRTPRHWLRPTHTYKCARQTLGLKTGDQIMEINGTDVTNSTMSDVSNHIQFVLLCRAGYGYLFCFNV